MKIEWKPDKDYRKSPHIVKDLYINGRRTLSWVALWGNINSSGKWRGATRNRGVFICNSEEEAKAITLAIHMLEEQ